ncbi:MATE family efflux transporter [Sutterella sp.]|uniref:MATE family efflux transporter n=1 Tax=Sutterella sp. TaxID=1981025 RepID=UPI0026DFD9A7|nr:MATE family efflux transporter [Sutterella sp.]MDO5532412.1 MATE family efflux transporter [Sutterella sp.]
MAKSRKQLDLLNGSLWDKMIVFAVPLALTGVLQQLFNAADVATLGHFVSRDAMAAVGNNVPVIGLIVSLCMGLALGANVIVARYIGMREEALVGKAVHTAFALAVIFGVVIAVFGELCSGLITELLEVPESVAGHAETYLRVYLLGMPFIAIYNFLAAVMRSRGDTKTPLYALVAATIFNIAGNLFFVLVLGMEAGGVALATALANGLAAAILFVNLLKSDSMLRLEVKKLTQIDPAILRTMVRIGWPAGLQGMVFSLSNLVIQNAINSLGPDAMAGSVAGFTIEINVYCFINAFGLAATTFVSQNYGAGNLERCRRATWVSAGINFVATLVLVAFVWYFAHDLLGLFSDTEEVIALGVTRIMYVVLPEPVNVIMETVSDAMRGYGYSLPPAIITLISICSIRVVWVMTMFAATPTYETLMMVYPISWITTTVFLCILYWRHQKSLEKKMAEKMERRAAAEKAMAEGAAEA